MHYLTRRFSFSASHRLNSTALDAKANACTYGLCENIHGHNYRVRVPFAGRWREALNSDAAIYGGSNAGNAGSVSTVVTRDTPELRIVVPPLAAVFFVPEIE